jgi:NADH-quinone oxidoreductase subunit D
MKADPQIGYLHTGIEKSCESKTYSQAITLTDRIDYLAPLSNNLGFCLAAEKLIGVEVPKRAQYIRVLLTELTRITSHLVWLGTHAIDLGAMSVFLYSFREREEIMKIYEYVSGQRMMTSYFRIGGLALEPPPGWLDRVARVVESMPGHIDEYETLLTQNRIWLPMPSLSAPPARCCAPAACPTTFARFSRTPATTTSISMCRRKPPAIATRVTRCAWRKCARA